jgi:hypothetical protein
VRRWHEERPLMLRRWRQEIAIHEAWLGAGETGYSYCALAPLPPTSDEKCHCYRGPGFLRKRKPHDCGNPRCGCCHYAKFQPKNRANVKREAIRFELEVAGA